MLFVRGLGYCFVLLCVVDCWLLIVNSVGLVFLIYLMLSMVL